MPSLPPVVRHLQFVDDAIVIAHWHNLRIFLVRGQVQMQHVSIVERGIRDLAALHPLGLASLGVIVEGTPHGERAVARRFAAMASEFAQLTRYNATVIEGSGVWARTMRTVVRGISMVGASGRSMHLPAKVEEALPELLPHVTPLDGASPRRAELLHLLEDMRAQPAVQAAAPSP